MEYHNNLSLHTHEEGFPILEAYMAFMPTKALYSLCFSFGTIFIIMFDGF